MAAEEYIQSSLVLCMWNIFFVLLQMFCKK
jgi:hypothetical protein